jgi:hypothetical protein
MKLRSLIATLLLLSGFQFLHAQDNEACLECHSDPSFTTERGGKQVRLLWI